MRKICRFVHSCLNDAGGHACQHRRACIQIPARKDGSSRRKIFLGKGKVRASSVLFRPARCVVRRPLTQALFVSCLALFSHAERQNSKALATQWRTWRECQAGRRKPLKYSISGMQSSNFRCFAFIAPGFMWGILAHRSGVHP